MNRRDFILGTASYGALALGGCASAPEVKYSKKGKGWPVDDVDREMRGSDYWNMFRIPELINPSGKEIPVVGLAGTGLNHSALTSMMGVFSHRGHPTITYHHPGPDDSGSFPTKSMPMSVFADLHHHMLKRWGIEECIAVGHSLGGMVMMQHATANPSMYRGMIVTNATDVSPFVTNQLVGLLSFPLAIQERAYQDNKEAEKNIRFFDYSGPLPEGTITEKIKFRTDPRSLSLAVYAVEKYDISDVVNNIDCPILIVHANGDKYVHKKEIDELAGRVRRPRVVEVNGRHYWFIVNPKDVKEKVLTEDNLKFIRGK